MCSLNFPVERDSRHSLLIQQSCSGFFFWVCFVDQKCCARERFGRPTIRSWRYRCIPRTHGSLRPMIRITCPSGTGSTVRFLVFNRDSDFASHPNRSIFNIISHFLIIGDLWIESRWSRRAPFSWRQVREASRGRLRWAMTNLFHVDFCNNLSRSMDQNLRLALRSTDPNLHLTHPWALTHSQINWWQIVSGKDC